MIDIYQLWIAVCSAVNTTQQGCMRPITNFNVWVNQVSKELAEEKFQEYQTTQKLTDDMRTFLKSTNVQVVSQNYSNFDLILYPPNYIHYASGRVYINPTTQKGCVCDTTLPLCKEGKFIKYESADDLAAINNANGNNLQESPITYIRTDEWSAATMHRTRKPTIQNPIITQFDGGLKIAPRGVGVIVMDYFRMPVDAYFAYTIDPVTDYIVYDPTNSVQLEWNPMMINEFVARIAKKYGVYIREEMVYATQREEQKELS